MSSLFFDFRQDVGSKLGTIFQNSVQFRVKYKKKAPLPAFVTIFTKWTRSEIAIQFNKKKKPLFKIQRSTTILEGLYLKVFFLIDRLSCRDTKLCRPWKPARGLVLMSLETERLRTERGIELISVLLVGECRPHQLARGRLVMFTLGEGS